MTPPPAPPEASDNDPSAEPVRVDDAGAIASALLASGLAAAVTAAAAGAAAADLATVRDRLLQRAGRSRQRDAALVTVRADAIGASDARRTLHTRVGIARPGEPDRIELLTMSAGTRLNWRFDAANGGPEFSRMVEWLVLDGMVSIDGESLATGDFCRQPMALDGHRIEAGVDARLYVRVGTPVVAAPSGRVISRDAGAVWDGDPAYLQRRVLWVDDAEVALLIRARAGVAIAPHRHRVDEECLVLHGEIFAGDVLIRGGDFQLAPAGCIHGIVRADTDALVYLRGDTDYEYVKDPAAEHGDAR